MLSKQRRLQKDKFDLVFKGSKVFSTNLFAIRAKKAEEKPRFAVVVPKKVYKLAHDRNRIRRQVFDAIENHILDSVCDVIFFVKPTIKNADKELIKNDVAQVMVEIHKKIS